MAAQRPRRHRRLPPHPSESMKSPRPLRRGSCQSRANEMPHPPPLRPRLLPSRANKSAAPAAAMPRPVNRANEGRDNPQTPPSPQPRRQGQNHPRWRRLRLRLHRQPRRRSQNLRRRQSRERRRGSEAEGRQEAKARTRPIKPPRQGDKQAKPRPTTAKARKSDTREGADTKAADAKARTRKPKPRLQRSKKHIESPQQPVIHSRLAIWRWDGLRFGASRAMRPHASRSAGSPNAHESMYPTLESRSATRLSCASSACPATRPISFLPARRHNPAGRQGPAGALDDRRAEKRGAIKPGDTLIEANLRQHGIALAMVAAIKGYRMISYAGQPCRSNGGSR